jgi:hypothetical protein
MKPPFLLFISILTLTSVSIYCQDKTNVKFGNVTASDFTKKVYEIDSNAHAVVIADIGSSTIEGNTKGWFSLVYKHYKRIHILNKNGYDAANVVIPLVTSDSDEEQLDKLKAVTYNMEDGKLVETKLDTKSGVFKDKINKSVVYKKFTFPNVKEGSIIEYEYTIVSDFLSNLQPWEFQGSYPRLWSEYKLMLPDFFHYVFLTQGYLKYDINERSTGNTSFTVAISEGTSRTERHRLESPITNYRWVIKNVPAIREEPYTSTVNNYIAKIEFQLSEYRQPLQYHRIMGTWEQLCGNLMRSEHFGLPLTKDNGWLKDVISPMMDGPTTKEQKARKIYEWVRDNITCTDYSDVFINQNLRNILKTRNGTIAEVNLLLTAMLRYLDIQADPMLLSTRTNGFIYPLYPLMSRFNYVACRATIDNKVYFLDASEPRLGFGHLPLRCYNGQARVIDKVGTAVELDPDGIFEMKQTTVFIINDEKGRFIGSKHQVPGYYESYSLRNKIKDKGHEETLKEIRRNFGLSAEINNLVIDSMDKYDQPIALRFEFDLTESNEDIIYLNPMFGEGYKDNPFKSAERHYPVEMPYTFDELYNLQLEVPAGYVTDELPQQVIIKLNEAGEGIFEYRISQSGSSISLRSRLIFKRSLFLPEEYDMLREFFGMIVKKHNEQIVFKKKK